MPELPEVEVVRLGLIELLPGLKVLGVSSSWDGSGPGEFISYSKNAEPQIVKLFSSQSTDSSLRQEKVHNSLPQPSFAKEKIHQAPSKSFPNAKTDVNTFLIGAKITGVRRRAKVLIIDLDTDYSLVIHLKMTGQLVFRSDDDSRRFGAGHPTNSLIGKLPDKSTRVIIELTSAKLFFNDQRKFGWVRLVPTIEIPNIDFFKKVGPEPLSAEFTDKVFIERIKKRAGSTIKAALLDQTVLAGVGNIYADESLWGAKIHPATRVKDVPDAKLKKLFSEIQYVLKLSIERGGSTDRNYVDAKGKKGSYIQFARVFRRENLPCPRCGTTIEKTRVAGRGTHTCPTCQKI